MIALKYLVNEMNSHFGVPAPYNEQLWNKRMF